MMTRITAAGARVTVYQAESFADSPGRWHWCRDADGVSQQPGFRTLADAVADAQRHCGADVAITRYTTQEPQP